MANPRNPNKYITDKPLPRVQCPATLGRTCGHQMISADVLHGAINKGKIRDHKVAPLREKRKRGDRTHELVLCPGSGRVVTIDPEDNVQLELDFGTVDYQEPTLMQAAAEIEAS